MKPKAPKKKDTKPSAKSGEVREDKNIMITLHNRQVDESRQTKKYE